MPDTLIIDYPRMLNIIKKKISKIMGIADITWDELTLKGNLALTQTKIAFGNNRYRKLVLNDFKCDKCGKKFGHKDLTVRLKKKGELREIKNLEVVCKGCRKTKKPKKKKKKGKKKAKKATKK